MPDMARARAGGLFPEAAPQALLQARQQPRIGPRAAGPAVTPEDRQRLLVLLAIRDTILILLIAVSLAGLRGGTPRNPQYARPAAIAWRMRRMTIRYGGRWKKSRAFPGTQPRAATDEPRATSHEPRAASDEPRATSRERRATGDEPRAVCWSFRTSALPTLLFRNKLSTTAYAHPCM